MIVGVVGLAGAGKDTFAEVLVEEYGYKRVSFADKMREALLALDPIVHLDYSDVWAGEPVRLSAAVTMHGWDRAKRDIPEVRQLLQRMGTEVGRDLFGLDFWVDQALCCVGPADKVVVTDVRFDNEADAIRKRHGLLVRINRPGIEPLPGGHASEALAGRAAFQGIEVPNTEGIDRLHTHARAVMAVHGVTP